MSNQLPVLTGTEADGCCAPLARAPISAADAAEMAAAFKALGDPVRLRLLSLIASHPDGEACVCDVTGSFGLTGPTISHHLKVLRSVGLIDCERRATWVYYWVKPATLARLGGLLDIQAKTLSGAGG